MRIFVLAHGLVVCCLLQLDPSMGTHSDSGPICARSDRWGLWGPPFHAAYAIVRTTRDDS